MSDARASIETLGDSALLVRFGSAVDAALNARVHRLSRRLSKAPPPWVRDIVPAYATLAVIVDSADPRLGSEPLHLVHAWLANWLAETDARMPLEAAKEFSVAVRYGGEFGPDLEAAALELGMTQEEVIARHVAGQYRVAMIGFSPGFPFLMGLDPAIALPRLAQPRVLVPGGSVGIGGAQTGIYPRDSPGGWRIIGRTSLVLFDASREPPALLAPGDGVRFVAE